MGTVIISDEKIGKDVARSKEKSGASERDKRRISGRVRLNKILLEF